MSHCESRAGIPSVCANCGRDSAKANETPTRIQNEPSCEMPFTVATPGSAMRGVILTDTGEVLQTPTPAPHPVELARLVLDSPRVRLNFGGIFDERHAFNEDSEGGCGEEYDEHEPASPSTKGRLILERKAREKENVSPQPSSSVPPTRLRKPSIRASLQRPSHPPSAVSCSITAPIIHPTQPLAPVKHSVPAPASYDFEDDDNLPSPFLKRTDKCKPHSRRGSAANDLRAKAAANAAVSSGKDRRAARTSAGAGAALARPSLERAKQASEDAKKALFRP